MKRNRTKKSLLLSVISLLLCVSMFAGSTYAWFTDEVSSGVNQIIAGNLDVELYHNTLEDGAYATSDTKVTSDTTDLFHAAADNVAVLWEPGAMAVEKFTVKNVGNLALKYKLSFNDLVEGFYNYVTWGDGTTKYDLTDVIKVAVSDTAITSRDTSLHFVSWKSFATGGAKVGKLAADAEESFYVVLYWAPNANEVDNLYNLKNGAFDATTNPNGYTVHATTAAATVTNAPNLSTEALELYPTITLIATQDTVESDSFDNQYDVNADGVNSYTVSEYQPVDTTQATTLVVNGVNGVEAQATISADLADALPDSVTSTALVLENRSEATTEDTVVISYQNVDLVDQNGNHIDLTALNEDIPVKVNIGAGLGVGAKVDIILDQGQANEQKFSTVSKTGYGTATYDNATGELSFTAKHFCPMKVEFEKPEAYNETTNTYYATLKKAVEDANSTTDVTDTIVLLKDVTINSKWSTSDNVALSVTDDMVLDGNGYTLNTTVGRGVWVDESNITLTIKDLTIDGKNSSERGVQINTSKTDVTLNLNNVEIKGFTYYTVNVCNGATCYINIDDCTISGWGALNLWSAGYKVTANNSTFIGVNDKSYNADGWNNFATIVLEGDSTGATSMGSSNNEVVLNNCEIVASQTTGNKQFLLGFNTASKDNIVKVNNSTFTIGDGCYGCYDNGTGNQLIIDGEQIN